MYEKLLKEIKINKFKILSFLIGYFLISLDFKMLDTIEKLFNLIDPVTLIISNLVYIFVIYFIIKKTISIYLDIIIISHDKTYIKIFKYLKIISLGSFVGFISIVFQAYVLVLLPF